MKSFHDMEYEFPISKLRIIMSNRRARACSIRINTLLLLC
jgi:hypothetical protein